MAIYPCDAGMHRYSQRQQSAYLTVLVGAQGATRRMRLCPSHFEGIELWAETSLDRLEDGLLQADSCRQCGDPKDAVAFLRLFGDKREETQYVADLCSPCALELVKQSLFASQTPLAER